MSVEIDISNGFSANIIDEFKEAFTFFDKNLTGTITTDKIGEVMRALGQNPTEKELKDIIQEVDGNNKGTISFDVFIDMMKCKLFTKDMAEELRESFRFFDENNTGLLDIHLLHTVLTTEGDTIEDYQFEDFLKDNEITDNDEINYENFVTFIFSK
ncbi:neo-calmodulin-like [Diorhabda carinulata]|uniref:neo-calmodulin-like n=1 Tax=Diorhabda carinulata TaxID=1163345 RepID=UPI0025A1423F|nr:neo-calmodulin-like [Diorhabda carinulata]